MRCMGLLLLSFLVGCGPASSGSLPTIAPLLCVLRFYVSNGLRACKGLPVKIVCYRNIVDAVDCLRPQALVPCGRAG